ncbi:MAG: SDR family oxidoreductase [Pseudomonadota bacterium]
MPTVLITGATKGIGLELATQYAAAGWTVYATHRGGGFDALATLGSDLDNVLLAELDVDDLDAIDRLAEQLSGVAIDVLINNAGRMGDGNDPSAQTGEMFGTLRYSLFDEYLRTNARGPIKMLEAFLPHVRSSSYKKMVTISSGAGSFGMPPGPPGLLWYKASKAAVNMLMVNAAKALQRDEITVLTFHPGLVLTERLKPMREKLLKISGQEKPFEVADAVRGIIQAIDSATPADSGSFLGNQGQSLPF